MTTLMEKVRGVFSELQARKIAGYKDAVRRRQAGEELDPIELATILDVAGKTPDEFEAEVLLYKKTSEATATVATGTKLLEELSRNNAEIERLNTEAKTAIERIRSEADRQIQTLQNHKREIDLKLSRVDDARRLLMTLSKPPAIAARLRELKIQFNAELQKIEDANSTLEAYRTKGVLTDARYNESKANIAAAETCLKEIQAEMSRVEWGTL